jgi:hypothetical protein
MNGVYKRNIIQLGSTLADCKRLPIQGEGTIYNAPADLPQLGPGSAYIGVRPVKTISWHDAKQGLANAALLTDAARRGEGVEGEDRERLAHMGDAADLAVHQPADAVDLLDVELAEQVVLTRSRVGFGEAGQVGDPQRDLIDVPWIGLHHHEHGPHAPLLLESAAA